MSVVQVIAPTVPGGSDGSFASCVGTPMAAQSRVGGVCLLGGAMTGRWGKYRARRREAKERRQREMAEDERRKSQAQRDRSPHGFSDSGSPAP